MFQGDNPVTELHSKEICKSHPRTGEQWIYESFTIDEKGYRVKDSETVETVLESSPLMAKIKIVSTDIQAPNNPIINIHQYKYDEQGNVISFDIGLPPSYGDQGFEPKCESFEVNQTTEIAIDERAHSGILEHSEILEVYNHQTYLGERTISVPAGEFIVDEFLIEYSLTYKFLPDEGRIGTIRQYTRMFTNPEIGEVWTEYKTEFEGPVYRRYEYTDLHSVKVLVKHVPSSTSR